MRSYHLLQIMDIPVYQTDDEAKRLTVADPHIRRDLSALVGDAVYAENETTLQQVVGELLRKKGMTISTAESCTGGLVASLLTSVPGASDYFLGSVVSYAYSVKENVLGVSPDIIGGYGAVSPECAAAMADGVRRLTGSDFAVSTTGNAGPAASENKDVGLVWVGISSEYGTQTMDFHFHNDRIRNRERFAASALDAVRKYILYQ